MGFIWIIGAIFLIYLIIDKGWFEKAKVKTNSDQPLQILKQRLASGEITKEEYNQLKHELDGK